MTIQEALAFGRQQLVQAYDPALDARLLLEYVLGKGHTFLVAHADESLPAVQEQDYRQLIERASQQEPVPYLTGEAYFFGRVFRVTPAVLIPRPETEQLVEQALKWAGGRRIRIVDVGTGSGCIAITLALEMPGAEVEATDISTAALAVAQENAGLHLVADRVRFQLGNLLEPVDGRVDLIVANLPYITDTEWTGLTDGVKSYEPVTALRGGPMGLDFIQALLDQSTEKLSPGGAIFLEIGWKQGEAVIELAQSVFPTARVELLADYAGIDRIVSIFNTA